jgi:hypothetical protein
LQSSVGIDPRRKRWEVGDGGGGEEEEEEEKRETDEGEGTRTVYKICGRCTVSLRRSERWLVVGWWWWVWPGGEVRRDRYLEFRNVSVRKCG